MGRPSGRYCGGGPRVDNLGIGTFLSSQSRRLDSWISIHLKLLGTIDLLLHVAGLVFAIGGMGWALYQTIGASQMLCTGRMAPSYEVPLLVIVVVIGFGAGRAVGSVRSRRLAIIRTGRNPSSTNYSAGIVVPQPRWLEVLLAVFLVAGALALAYETWAVLPNSNAYPITSYIRCAEDFHPLLAAGFAGGIAFLVSNWFWYPNR